MSWLEAGQELKIDWCLLSDAPGKPGLHTGVFVRNRGGAEEV